MSVESPLTTSTSYLVSLEVGLYGNMMRSLLGEYPPQSQTQASILW